MEILKWFEREYEKSKRKIEKLGNWIFFFSFYIYENGNIKTFNYKYRPKAHMVICPKRNLQSWLEVPYGSHMCVPKLGLSHNPFPSPYKCAFFHEN